MNRTTVSEIMKRCFLFSGIEDETVIGYLADGRVTSREYKAGEVIRSGEERCVSVIISGTANVTSVKTASNAILRILKKGDAFGAATAFSRDEAFISRITAVTDLSVCVIPSDYLSELINSDSIIAFNFIAFLSDRIRFLNRKIESFTAGDAEARVANYLASLSSETGNIVLPVSFSRLAQVLDVSRASVYRAFDSLEECGAIEKNGKDIVISNLDKLYEIGK